MRTVLAWRGCLALALTCGLVGALTASAADDKVVELFNGKDFTGWKLFIPDPAADVTKTWSVKDGIIHCTGEPAGYFRTTTPYADYELTLEWRFPGKGGNSGVLLHVQDKDEVWPKSIEAQLNSGDAGDIWVIGGTTFKEHGGKEDRRVPKKEKSSEKPLGEWNQYRIVCKGDTIELYVNGVLQNRATQCSVTSGYIGFQSEGTPIEFRNIRLRPLKD
ncbi:MAG TPA: DUF1080 domain-containing protein [Candidatus Hydrogenedentes bacterium]|nr:DUF1080 domain-containing protein [Candidatus Hydrogenedentota bacterium]HOJ69296.1 DUF1080 domain-containing protein [Candidatus Hydrogenedentota bacterium]HOK89271.1 DUF1080 domain-containing protein [Candidatus Hydrogenedentota bacterium]HOV59673.1 DUF1080 domain-containing protein [Candidatus Hydrogenedentota bacterium]